MSARTGAWKAYAWKTNAPFGPAETDIRCAMLEIVHSKGDDGGLDWFRMDRDIGVDSGQAGFFDEKGYVGRGGVGGEEWYERCSSTFLPEDRNRLLRSVPGGVVSDSGHGDGGYDLWVKRQDGVVVRAAIVFLPWVTAPDDPDDRDDSDEYGHDSHPDRVRTGCYGGQ